MAPLPPVFSAMARVAAVAAPILAKAFVDAYKQAMINAAANGARNAALRNNKMSKDEAAKILNLDGKENMEAIMEKYQHLFDNNDPAKGGSAYLQTKIETARKVLSEGSDSSSAGGEAGPK
mmetsp:Transcript_38939/g.60675  ORF Transcript_38939/g.60675 Transcript_38939/m.60675 type:complete len:121 (-) Transcript_38939:174-536(-)|eukprot:CAMPEP_0184297742 /NCGR_PEP_ID=MMETSP1049-20130417/8625_1 /TAXON_ID=77928 /ORGANISM="Proteomonas sulcata, Strain CCMP704" /LENGTH=120 /DNA_ID=CAMNT_0026607603 /DNA_START=147 /DNA_END=509 /DNA_ORIENTATION=-